RFSEQKIPDREFADVAVLKCAAEVFRAFFGPAFADLNLSVGFFFGFNVDLQIVFTDVITDHAARVVRCAEKNVDLAEVADRSLRVDVDLAKRLGGVAEKFDAHRQRRLPRIKIDNSAANRELTAGRDLRDALVTGGAQFFEQL